MLRVDRQPTQIAAGCTGSRREFLWEMGAGFAGLALTGMLDHDGFFARHGYAAESSQRTHFSDPLSPRPAHADGKAKRCIFIFQYGGPSAVDTWDYKPELQKRDGQTVDLEVRRNTVQKKTILASRRKFERCGESGLWCSDAFPYMSQIMDELCVIKSLYADTFAHGSGMLQMNTGQVLQGYPSLGSWLGYGLGSAANNLPGYIVMLDPRGGPISGSANWTSGFMPAAYQGTHLRNQGDPILDLSPSTKVTREMQRKELDTLAQLNAEHLQERPGYSELPARISSYELAYQLQMSAPEAMDISAEDHKTQEMYGLFDPKPTEKLSLGSAPFGQQCLIARRLLERGVRYVQIYTGGGHQQESWDAHADMEENLRIHAPEIDRPVHGLITDLKRRGMLDDTLVICGGEFGRQPVSENNEGRDHNPQGFLYWLAGGGVRAGHSYGELDELGYAAAQNRHHIRDLHATILHLMGLDHEKLTYFYGGLDHKLTGVKPAEVIRGIVA
ncbi:MAG: DUF1501 domain-containing protein [Pirellulaceae bacterium]|nr:DUF1501 domain-containing protein [Pirellulaceae bacterium]